MTNYGATGSSIQLICYQQYSQIELGLTGGMLWTTLLMGGNTLGKHREDRY